MTSDPAKPAILEQCKRPGVCYAMTNDGVELPVVDVTHPAFEVTLTDAEMADAIDRFLRGAERREKLPDFGQRLMLRVFLRRSVLGRGLGRINGQFLHGLDTYLFKLGSENLGAGWASPADRKIAASLPGLSMRLRLQDMAAFAAEGLAPALARRPAQPLHLLSIAGGPAMDSLNTLLLLRKQAPGSLSGREVFIHVLDLESEAPDFGRRAVAALQSGGAPLCGLKVEYQFTAYNWGDAKTLRDLLAGLGTGEGVFAVSAEGGLFDYGSDEEIVANLATLRAGTPADTVVVGTIGRPDGPALHLHRGVSRGAARPRSLEVFSDLARRGGWSVDKVVERPFSRDLRMRKGTSGEARRMGVGLADGVVGGRVGVMAQIGGNGGGWGWRNNRLRPVVPEASEAFGYYGPLPLFLGSRHRVATYPAAPRTFLTAYAFGHFANE